MQAPSREARLSKEAPRAYSRHAMLLGLFGLVFRIPFSCSLNVDSFAAKTTFMQDKSGVLRADIHLQLQNF